MRFPLQIDHRERKKPYTFLLDSHPAVEIEYTTLGSGDIRVTDLIIERKLLPDLILTLNEDRLFRQLIAMKNDYPRQLLIVEGISAHNERLRLTLRGLFTRIAAGWQIPILFAKDPQELVDLIIAVTRQTFTASAGPISPRPRRKSERNLAVAHKMLIQIPGIGPTRSRDLLKNFGSIQNCLNASAQELSSIDGIGKKTAERFIAHVRKDYS